MKQTTYLLLCLSLLAVLATGGCAQTITNPPDTDQPNPLEDPTPEPLSDEKNSITTPQPVSSGQTQNQQTDNQPATSTEQGMEDKYKDGTYTQTGTYNSPAGPESILVTLTIKDDTVTAVNVKAQATNEASVTLQKLFIEGIASAVVGKPVDEANVSKVNGSSLTPNGFNAALSAIKTQADQ